MRISAFVPCFNNARTVLAAVESLRRQCVEVDQLFVIDDCSTDESVRVVESAGIQLIRLESNLGRGAVRQRALLESRHEFVLSCDGTNTLPDDFAFRSLRWFEERRQAAAVYGRMVQSESLSFVDRWRGRHLFKEGHALAVETRASLITWGVMLRRSAVLAVGNFDSSLRQSEDRELGKRLLAAGYDVVFDPSLSVKSQERGEMSRTLERYWRWYSGEDPSLNVNDYLKDTLYSLKVMAREDLAAGDPLASLMSVIAPHYKMYRSALHRYESNRKVK